MHAQSSSPIADYTFKSIHKQNRIKAFGALHSNFSYLQKFSSSIRKSEFPQHTNLNLITDCGTFSTIESVCSLHLLGVTQLLQPFDHLFYNEEVGNWRGNKERNGGNIDYFLNCETVSLIAMVRYNSKGKI